MKLWQEEIQSLKDKYDKLMELNRKCDIAYKDMVEKERDKTEKL